MSDSRYRFGTLALHAGQTVDAPQSRAAPVYGTSSYVFKNTEHAANLFALKEPGSIYTRLMNPSTDILEQRAGGLTPDLIRLSIGLEHPDDILEALARAQAAAPAVWPEGTSWIT